MSAWMLAALLVAQTAAPSGGIEIEDDAAAPAASGPSGPSGPQEVRATTPPAPAKAPEVRPAANLANNNHVERHGYLGWGLGIEAPLAGVTTGVGSRSSIGWGYSLGGAISWEATPEILLRIYGAGGETSGGQAPLRYRQNNANQNDKAPAGWLGIELGLGGAYQFRSAEHPFTPYVGLDGGVRFSGHLFEPDSTQIVPLQAPDLINIVGQSGNDSLSVGWTLGVRGGMRFELSKWLATLLDLQVAYVLTPDEPVSNTLDARAVESPSESVFLVRLTFSVRLAL